MEKKNGNFIWSPLAPLSAPLPQAQFSPNPLAGPKNHPGLGIKNRLSLNRELAEIFLAAWRFGLVRSRSSRGSCMWVKMNPPEKKKKKKERKKKKKRRLQSMCSFTRARFHFGVALFLTHGQQRKNFKTSPPKHFVTTEPSAPNQATDGPRAPAARRCLRPPGRRSGR